jgi:hypothetical protein
VSAAPYRIALASRGAGAFAYTYSGPPGLQRGQLAAVRFRGSLEFGLVIEADPAPPEGIALQPLLVLRCSVEDWGELLLELCDFTCAAPDELLPRLVLTGSAAGLRLSLLLQDAAALPVRLRAELESASGVLTPTKRKLLAREGLWNTVCELAAAGTIELHLAFAGQPGVSSTRTALRQWHQLDTAQRTLLGLGHSSAEWWPGGYLAGLKEPPKLAGLPHKPAAPAAPAKAADGALEPQFKWQPQAFPADWEVAQHWPATAILPLRRAQCSWPELRGPTGLPAELARAVGAGQRVLLIVPQAWMLDRLWPALAGLAPQLLRHAVTQPPGALAQLLYSLEQAGQGQPGLVVAGSEAAWRLAGYAEFDRAILLDPSHPQWQPEGAPWLDPRGALLLALARRGTPLDIIELGLSAFDGQVQPSFSIYPPHDPAALEHGPPGSLPADTNPLPFELRQPHLRRLVYFNRLGASRGLQCAECGSCVPCPRCGSRAVHYSAQRRNFVCPDCGLSEHELRCPRCGLGTLAARLPGLEAMRVRPGELLVHGPQAVEPGPEHYAILGTAQLLEPVTGFWPEQVVYLDPEERDLLGSDWREALDMAARLAALYANPALHEVCIVSARLAARLAEHTLVPEQAAVECLLESRLRKLGGLPPYGCLYHLRALADRPAPLAATRELLGSRLSQEAGTSLLRLGKPFTRGRRAELHGFLLNPELAWPTLQELRWEVHAQGATLSIAAGRGPWL